ncbi:MAG TPA: metalloregulator ArsR/SmtB family transcription factor [Vicinamibacteria bacterium]|nr:metalloregulator ArsR/SmtB family transcription factor [Vicinamibacteria bacterium]
MVYNSHTLDATFGALADPTRRAILGRLARGDASITELARPFAFSLPAVSKHLRVLESAGLMTRRKEGRAYQCHLRAGPMEDAASWIEGYRRFWATQLEALAQYLEASRRKDDKQWPRKRMKRSSKSAGPSVGPARGSSGRGRRPKS